MERSRDDYKTTVNSFSYGRVEKQDKSIPFRLVGSYEYANCLRSFQTLLSISDREEILTYDKILAERPEFTYFQGNPAMFDQQVRIDGAPMRRDRLGDKFLKNGLASMMALARVELGATMAMYGKSKTPFEDVSDSSFDRLAYLRILAVDFVEHMKALRNDVYFHKQILRRQRTVDADTLAYLRRVKMVCDMLEAASKIASSEELARLREFHNELKKYIRKLEGNIQFHIMPKWDTNAKNHSDYSRRTLSKTVGRCIETASKHISETSESSKER